MKRKRSRKLSALRRELDRVFAAWVRARDYPSGWGRCISCGRERELEAGHFLPRQHTATRYDERNVHGQCSYCNRWLHGAQADYYRALLGL